MQSYCMGGYFYYQAQLGAVQEICFLVCWSTLRTHYAANRLSPATGRSTGASLLFH